MKECRTCGEHKPYSEFHRMSKSADGHQYHCKPCRDARRMRDVYGITIEDYDSMFEEQGGGCAICGTTAPGGKGRFHIDHCHESGEVRALLCTDCNTGLGKFKDNPLLIRAAALYLEKHNASNT